MEKNHNAVVDPDFPKGGGLTPEEGSNLLFGIIFAETACKWKLPKKGEIILNSRTLLVQVGHG